jgi:peptide/nickel transport system substrate-binding protein
LTEAGWTLNTKTGVMEKKAGAETNVLTFSIATGDATELRRTAEFVKEDWEKIGASVELKVSEIGELNQNVIRPRKFDAILFGEVVGRELDLFPFWHSSQRNDPGLNISLYANISADKILEDLRLTQDRDERMEKVKEFEELFKRDLPANFIYSPHFIYITPRKLENVSLGELSHSGERYLNVHEWYIEKNKVWRMFAY